ncbi:MAG: sn-glycerol-3-phosphate ABC transporter permease [Gammaproteobacteria bacterium]|nr:sn-glycerol-3-phosphate ABC transporter permease [Gammaproteobacteria bacterium]
MRPFHARSESVGVAGDSPTRQWLAHLVLLVGVFFLLTPIALILFASTHDTGTLQTKGLPWFFGEYGVDNYKRLWFSQRGFTDQVTPMTMLQNSVIVASGVAMFTTAFSLLSAYAIVFFKMRYSGLLFWLILTTLLFPLESRFVTTFHVTSSLGLINTHLGIILPTVAAALGTFFFRQFYLTLPKELIEAAMLDGAGSVKFLIDIVIPLSISRAGAVFVIAFMIGWNQYLWPLMISTDDSLYTLVRGIRLIGQESGPGMALVMLTLAPPFILLLMFQRWFFNSLADLHR